MITMYCIPQGIDKGIFLAISQYDQIRGEIVIVTKYKREILKDIISHVKSLEGIKIIIKT